MHIGDIAKEHVEQINEQNAIWIKPQEEEILKTVDMKKLEKADAKRKQKLDKKENLDASKQAASEKNAGPTTNQVIQKKELKKDLAGERVVDIRIENFDLAYGSKLVTIYDVRGLFIENRTHFYSWSPEFFKRNL